MTMLVLQWRSPAPRLRLRWRAQGQATSILRQTGGVPSLAAIIGPISVEGGGLPSVIDGGNF